MRRAGLLARAGLLVLAQLWCPLRMPPSQARDSAATWTGPVVVGASEYGAVSASGSMGRITLVWTDHTKRPSRLVVVRRVPGGNWTRPRALDSVAGGSGLVIAENANGDTVVAYAAGTSLVAVMHRALAVGAGRTRSRAD